jgi:hypothetical protein
MKTQACVIFAIATLATGLRLHNQDNACLDFNSNLFPLKVDSLLAGGATKAQYWSKLAKMGLPTKLEIVGDQLHHTCLKKGKEGLHVFIAGDSTMRGLYGEVMTLMGKEVDPEIMNRRMTFLENEFSDTEEQMTFAMSNSSNFDREIETGDGGFTYVEWIGKKDILDTFASLTKSIDMKKESVVFWMGTAIHNLFPKHAKMAPWWANDRGQALRSHIAAVQERFPDATLVWDTPNYLDLSIMKASPPKHGIGWISSSDAMHKLQKWGQQDEEVCNALGVPFTSRTKLGRFYRGLVSDGMHYSAAYGSSGYQDFDLLVFQSGLSRACTQKEALFCKDLEHDYDAAAGM